MRPDSDIFDSNYEDTGARKYWMGVLARAETGQLERALGELDASLDYTHLRQPEVGMAMVRGRADARGARFNLGEMTIARCSVRLTDGVVGHGYVSGRDRRHAELAAVFDALLQTPHHGPALLETVIDPLHEMQTKQRRDIAAKTAATRVNFFTMVRGED